METSEVMTTEDIDKLDSVIQLNPHQKTVEYTTVGKSEDDDLISVDELYEKTGQENIERILAGLESLLKYNKLTRDQGLLLKVQGAESWLELPDRMNAIKGGEGFISSVVNGFFDIIRAIIKFVKGICVWIYRRIMSLFGFEKSKEEKVFLYRKEQEAKKAVVHLYKSLGVDVDYGKLAEDLKSSKSTREQMNTPDFNPTNALIATIGDKNSNGKEIISSIPEVLKEIDEFKKLSDAAAKNIEIADIRYKKISLELREVIRKNNLTVGDIGSIKYQLASIATENLNPNTYVDSAFKLLDKISSVGGKKITLGLGLSDKLKQIREMAQGEVTKVVVEYDKEIYDGINDAAEDYYNNKHSGYSQILAKTGMKKLSGILNEKDADIIASISQKLDAADLTQAYSAFSSNLKTYASAIEIMTQVVQKAEAGLQNIIDSHRKIEFAITAMLAKDVNALLDKKLDLSTSDYKLLFEGDNPLFSFRSINTQFIKAHPDAKTSKAIGMAAQAYAKSPEGKKVKDAARTFITSFQRKR